MKISTDHAEIRAAPHQALSGIPEDGAELCAGEPQAGAAGPYPFLPCAPGRSSTASAAWKAR